MYKFKIYQLHWFQNRPLLIKFQFTDHCPKSAGVAPTHPARYAPVSNSKQTESLDIIGRAGPYYPLSLTTLSGYITAQSTIKKEFYRQNP